MLVDEDVVVDAGDDGEIDLADAVDRNERVYC